MLIAFSVGCEQRSEIRRYTVAKKSKAAKVAEAETVEPSRMLAAILFEGKQSWFFKLTAAPDNAESAVDGFRSLLKSITFVDGAPTWTLPEGWQPTASESRMRFATLAVPGDDGVMEMSVIPLPFDGDKDGALNSNIIRWRDQLSLPPQEFDQIQSSIEALDYDGGVANFVDLTGTSRSNSGMGGMRGGAPFAPFAGGRQQPPESSATNRSPSNPPSTPQSNPVTLAEPDGWTRSSNDAFSAMAYDIADGVRFTVTRLGGPGAKDLLPNVNRWRRQMGLDKLTAEQLEESVESVEIDGQKGSYVRAIGDKKAILGVSLLRGDQVWFFKLTGPVDATQAERENFENVLKTIQFPSE